MLILVVDDDGLVRRVVADLLEDSECTVIEASSGDEALQVIRETPELDLVISDVNMPEMDGVELEEEVRSMRPSLPVILMSGRPLNNRADAFLPKPFTRSGLLDCILRATAHAARQTERSLSPP